MDRGESTEQVIYFPPFQLDIVNERLERAGQLVTIRPKALSVLTHLAERPGRLVRKEELLEAVWPGTYVSDTVVKVCVREIREALGDDPRAPRYLETVIRRGYRFIGSRAPSSETSPPEVRGLEADPWTGSKDDAIVQGMLMVGRRRELRKLFDALANARRGQRQLVFITGDPGIGKTTLINAFQDRLVEVPDPRLATGQCLEFFGSGESYMPVLEMLNRLCQGPQGAEAIELFRRRAPSWLLQMPWLVSETEQEDLRRRTRGLGSTRMLREMVEALEALSSLAPLVLMLEDLHWSDGATLDLISALIRRPEPGHLMILGTFRPTELEAGHPLSGLWQDLRLRGLCQELALELLTRGEVEQYLSRRLPDAPVASALVNLVHRRTEGHPLFVVHLTDYMIRLLEIDHDTSLSGVLETGEFRVPGNLRQMIEGLLQRLTPEERELLEAASVAGVRWSATTVAAALEVEVEAVENLAEELVRRQDFLRSDGTSQWPDGSLAGRYRFVHALYQSVLYLRLTETTRMRFHQRMGQRLELGFGSRTPEIAGELAMHFERGRKTRQAVKYREQAAQTAIRRSGYAEAIVHLRGGLELLNAFPHSDQLSRELALRTALGPALMTTRGFTAPEVLANYTRAHELCVELRKTPDHLPTEHLPVFWGRWMFHWMRADYATARKIGQHCLTASTLKQQTSLAILAHRMMGGTLFNLGDLQPATDHLDKSLALYETALYETQALCKTRTQSQDARGVLRYTADSAVFCHSFRAHLLWLSGFPGQARKACRRACAIARELDHPFSLALACGFAGTIYLFCGDLDAAREHIEQARQVAENQGFPLFLAAAEIRRGALRVEEGHFSTGLDDLRQGVQAWAASGARQWHPLNLLFLATAALKSGQLEQGLAAVDEALETVSATGERWCLPELLRLRGEFLLQTENTGEEAGRRAQKAESCFDEALRVARAQGARAWESRIAASLARLHSYKDPV